MEWCGRGGCRPQSPHTHTHTTPRIQLHPTSHAPRLSLGSLAVHYRETCTRATFFTEAHTVPFTFVDFAGFGIVRFRSCPLQQVSCYTTP